MKQHSYNFSQFAAMLLIICSLSTGAAPLPAADSSDVFGRSLTQATAGSSSLQLQGSKADRRRLLAVTGITAAALGGTYVAHIEPWWSGKKQGFRFKYDWYDNYWLEIDKLGHFYANIQLTRLSAASFRFAGLSERKSLWSGFLVSTAFFTSIELTDAGFADWGFSLPDYTANLLGALYPILQHEVAVFRHFNFKVSYLPSQFYKETSVSTRPGFVNYQPYTYYSGDYDGVRYWLSADVDWILPDKLKPLWPDWLNIALGYGARNLPQANKRLKEREFYIALDYNMAYLPGESTILKSIKTLLNTIHLPAPALKISRSGDKMFLLKF